MRRRERNLFAVVVLFLDFFGCLLHDGQFAVTHGLSCDRSLEGRSVGRRVFLDRGARERECVSLSSGGGGASGSRGASSPCGRSLAILLLPFSAGSLALRRERVRLSDDNGERERESETDGLSLAAASSGW